MTFADGFVNLRLFTLTGIYSKLTTTEWFCTVTAMFELHIDCLSDPGLDFGGIKQESVKNVLSIPSKKQPRAVTQIKLPAKNRSKPAQT